MAIQRDTELQGMYDNLQKTISDTLNQKDDYPRDYGNLGYQVNGILSVMSQSNRETFYVKMKDGSFRDIPHRGNVNPILGLPVVIRYMNDDKDRDRSGYIAGPNEAELMSFSRNSAAISSVGKHTHHRGSGNEFPIDLRLIQQLSGRFGRDMNVVVQPGYYFVEGGFRYFPGGSVDLSSYRPTATTYKRWVIIGIDPATNELSVAQGSAVAGFITLSEATLESIVLSPANTIPLMAVMIYQNRAILSEFDFVALYNIAGENSSGYKVKADEDDTVPGYLEDSLEGTIYITLSTVDIGAGDTVIRFTLADLPASKITSGVFDIARIPALPYGTMSSFGIAGDSGTGTITDGETLTFDGTGGIVCTVTGNTVAIDGSGIASSFTLAGDTGTSAIINGDTLTVAGSSTIVTAVSGDTVTVSVKTNSIDASHIVADAITSSELADNAVDTNAIQNLAVTAAKIANNTITAAQIAADTITATEIAANAITSSELADNSVDTNAIIDEAVTIAKIADGTNSYYLGWDGTGEAVAKAIVDADLPASLSDKTIKADSLIQKRVLTANLTVPDTYCMVLADYLKINSGVALTLSGDAELRIV